MAPFLEINNVYKSFGGVEVLKGVSLSIQKGEIHCLAGENGCGKSTLIKIISGYYQKDSGELKIEGTPVSTITPRIAMSKGIQVVYQDFSLYPSMTIAENIVLADSLQKKKFLVNWKWVNSEASKALGRIKVDIDVSASVDTLSIAKKQLVAIAKALYQEAKLVILDEPTEDCVVTQPESPSLGFEVISGSSTLAEQQYNYCVTLVDKLGNESTKNEWVHPLVTQAKKQRVKLSWLPVTSAVQYKIYGRRGDSIGLMKTVNSDVHEFTDDGSVTPDQSQYEAYEDVEIKYNTLTSLNVDVSYADRQSRVDPTIGTR